jgi:hypothetical protein
LDNLLTPTNGNERKNKMQAMALTVSTKGTILEMDTIDLTALQTAVGGYVQAVDLGDDLTMWLNEEGKLEGLPHNEVGQVLWDATYGAGTDYIVGDIAITGGTDEEGETLPLTASAVSKIMQMLN